ncbi:diacylglycerol kinase family protein [Aurantimonas sp. Leaf443]|uniref:diacylglycerol/lipid kinase family protein n=1 Tax=Aurantimonas sp. Leaf443 TaxID=1736378 RepID=UPI0006F8B44D|nr:diacylglycerol kinase family protein [Aurantimonas sp. Leaf443]KQT82469.1 diacylglycerol kinase [Aurantimonas sp. Leaf443]
MRVLTLLNQDGGTLRTADLDELTTLLEGEFQVHGHEITVKRCEGARIVEEIGRAAKSREIDVLMVGGGDGTVSAAAEALYGTEIALAILPAGTMNLFARTLQIPLALPEAIAALATGVILPVDLATVNGKPYVHQFAVGIHARMVRMRKHMNYGSRLGKIMATTRAAVTSLKRLPLVELQIEVDGEARRIRTPALAISNNMYEDGHIPYADDPRGGVLGVYICEARRPIAVMKLTLDIVRGRWRENPYITVVSAQKVVIDYPAGNKEQRAVRDGELDRLDSHSVVEIQAEALKVVAPHEASYVPAELRPAA